MQELYKYKFLLKSPKLKLWAFLILFLCITPAIYSLLSDNITIESEQKQKSDETRVSFIFAGDIMFHKTQIKAAQVSNNTYDFTVTFNQISSLLKNYDFAVGNLETTFGGEPYSGYPAFSAPDTIAWFLKEAGFNVLVTSNNHSSDKGKKGVNGTINALERNKLYHTGTFVNEESRNLLHPLYLTKNGLKIALLNYTYGTNNGGFGLLINKIDTIAIEKDLKKAKGNGSDAVIAVVHWGNEYERKPNSNQKKIADFLFRKGVVAIVGSHPHVIQGFEKREYFTLAEKTTAFCAYSLGNLVSNQRWRYSDGGLLLSFDIVKKIKSNVSSVENIKYEPCWVHTYYTENKKIYEILPSYLLEGKSSSKLNQADYMKMKQYVEDTHDLLKEK